SGGANYSSVFAPRPLIRLAELYLNLAECYAELGNTEKALENINVIRRRAGATELTADMVTRSGKSIVEWARDERSIELFDEMHRYFDVRRWCKGHLLGNGQRMGLNAHVQDPTFEEFNKPVSVNLGHLYTWGDRMYLYPIDAQELYSNPQFVQSPGY
ncbi:MAG: RagB/SusD family nutrient uptake outer membrane protein, partial [Muribaculaceae bacterium]|nr:RagB/SusD family nutrient uptake outer membrane protein [Muribaculaceae bacterium]